MKKGDKILIAIILIITLSVSFMLWISANKKTAQSRAVVQINGKVIMTVALEYSDQPRTYDLEFEKGIAILETSQGRIRMLPMDKDICPEVICSDTVWIEGPLDPIVCLPNKIIVTVSKSQKQDLDYVVR